MTITRVYHNPARPARVAAAIAPWRTDDPGAYAGRTDKRYLGGVRGAASARRPAHSKRREGAKHRPSTGTLAGQLRKLLVH